MKRPCALISLTLIFALMLSLSATAHANESISDYDSPKASRENSYRIDFQELICKGWFLPPNTYDCGSFVVN